MLRSLWVGCVNPDIRFCVFDTLAPRCIGGASVKKSIACIVASLAFGMAGAMAEEMAVPPSQFITASVPYLAWTGFYVGINGGFAWSNSSVAFTANDPAALAGTCGGGGAPGPKGQCINSVDFRRDGAIAGGQFGFNWQVNSHWLVGAEADYQWSDLDSSVSSSFRLGNVGATTMAVNQTVGAFGTVRARAGVVLAPPLLLYGTGGFAFGQVHENLSVSAGANKGLTAGGFSYACTIGTACFAGTASQTQLGWSAGAGAEYAITSNLIFRTELLYVHLSAPTATVTATAVAAGTAPASFAAGFSSVYFAVMRGGLNYRF
jgi:outer membrane immunogenic protein